MEERTNSPAARLYRSMYLIRRVEEEIIRLYPTDKIKSPVHLSIGQEAVSAAVCDHLEKSDVLFGTYRGHALYLAKGGDVPRMMAELYGKVDGCARGKAGSMHLVDPSVNMMGTSAVVATGISNAVGAALALKMQKSKAIVVCFFGEGATDEGAWHESMNFASLRKLPILFVCENNFYAIYSHVKDRSPAPACRRAATPTAFRAELVEDHEPMKLHERAGAAVAAVRGGDGPRFLECMTYRWRDHVGPGEDRVHKYRPDEELNAKIEGDNLKIVGDLLPADQRKSIEAAEEKRVADAIAFAEASTFPEDQEVYDHVFCGLTIVRSRTARPCSRRRGRRWRATRACSSWARASMTRAACSAPRSACTRSSGRSAASTCRSRRTR